MRPENLPVPGRAPPEKEVARCGANPTGGGAARARLREDSRVPSAPLSPTWDRLALHTADGERLEAIHVEGPDPMRDLVVVVAHGFTQSLERAGIRSIVAALSRYAGVIAF